MRRAGHREEALARGLPFDKGLPLSAQLHTSRTHSLPLSVQQHPSAQQHTSRTHSLQMGGSLADAFPTRLSGAELTDDRQSAVRFAPPSPPKRTGTFGLFRSRTQSLGNSHSNVFTPPRLERPAPPSPRAQQSMVKSKSKAAGCADATRAAPKFEHRGGVEGLTLGEADTGCRPPASFASPPPSPSRINPSSLGCRPSAAAFASPPPSPPYTLRGSASSDSLLDISDDGIQPSRSSAELDIDPARRSRPSFERNNSSVPLAAIVSASCAQAQTLPPADNPAPRRTAPRLALREKPRSGIKLAPLASGRALSTSPQLPLSPRCDSTGVGLTTLRAPPPRPPPAAELFKEEITTSSALRAPPTLDDAMRQPPRGSIAEQLDSDRATSPEKEVLRPHRNSIVKQGTALKENVRETWQGVRSTWGLLAQCEWQVLVALARARTRRFLKSVFRAAQNDHTVVAVLYPPDDPSALSDTQCVQIFWTVLNLELAMLAFLYSNSTSSTVSIVAITIEALITVIPCVFAAILTRLLFRWANRGYRQHRWGRREKRERVMAEVKYSMSKQEKQELAVRLRKKQLDIGFGKHWSGKERRGLARFVAVWTLVLLFQVACTLLYMVQAYLFGEEKMRTFLLSFCISLGSDFAIIEPVEVLGLVLLPFFFDAGCCVRMRLAARELGFV